ncbi:hybrid sensor histidine kinase/response regulator [Arsukibacterium indicum]|uniref:histidine kinase n=1 Tax=Arsukibacterium indicum TaxID=2848612 RepID=A0ABS6MHL2_9GAMM|nr:hybrid sensor histidine kinase/response regulator [Arsukibacterium indicum]MBV2128298.1 response regulator [Arsukibacterium indicum]
MEFTVPDIILLRHQRYWLARIMLLLVAVLAIQLPALAATFEHGMPLLHNLKPKDYHAGTQNWALLQDQRGVLYVGNNVGVLEYDGQSWRTLQTSNKSVARSLALSAQGIVYVGAKGDLGYIDHSDGHSRFQSLLHLIPSSFRDFRDVRQTFVSGDSVYFASRDYVFRLKNGKVDVWQSNSSFLKAFLVNQRLYIREEGTGLLVLEQDNFQLVPGGDHFAAESLFVLEPFDDNTLLAGSREAGLYLLNQNGVKRFATAYDQQIKQAVLYSGLTLNNGDIALGTVQNGVFILSKQGKLVGHYNRNSGLLDQNVRAMYQDHQGGLWLGLDHGLSRIALNSAITAHHGASGLAGNVLSLTRYQQQLYAGTSLGLFRLQPRDDGSGQFVRVAPLQKQTWGFADFKGRLLIANNDGVYQLEQEQANLIRPSTQASKILQVSGLDPNRVYVGLQDGLATMRYVDGQWQDEGLVPGVEGNLNSIIELADGQLWLGTLAHGVYRLQLPASWQGGASVPLAITRFTKEHGLPSLNRNSVHLFDQQLVVASVRGIISFNSALQLFEPATAFETLFSGEQPWVRNPTMDQQGRVWMLLWDNVSGKRFAGVAQPDASGQYQWQGNALQPLADIPLDTMLVELPLIWFGGAEGIFRFADDQYQQHQPKPPLLRKLLVDQQQAIYTGGDLPELIQLGSKQKNLRFQFSSPNYNPLQPDQLQVRLLGHDEQWSSWRHEHYRDYTNLNSGHYQFQLRAKSVTGQISEGQSVSFQIASPWYWHWSMLFTYLLLAMTLLYLLHRWRMHSAIIEQRRLSQQVTLRTEHLEQAMRQLQQARETAENATLAKAQFLANMSHELRTPLNAVLGFAELAETTPALTQKQHYLQKIRSAGKILLSIINDILDFSKIEAGKLELEHTAFSLRETLSQVEDLFSNQLAAKGLNYQRQLADDVADWRSGDPLRLSQVLMNLLSNAIKFTEKGDVKLQISAQSPDQLLFSISDTGIGIDTATQAQLFQPFQQADNSVSRKYGGTGLGLTICQRLVSLMGSELQLRSQPGVGSTFSFSLLLPVAKHPQQAGTDASLPESEAEPKTEPENSSASQPERQPRQILVVDDNYFNQNLLKLMLEKLSYQVHLVSGGQQALDWLQQHHPAAILLDIEMPGMNGFATLAAIRQRAELDAVPVIALTAHNSAELLNQIRQSGFSSTLTKPIELTGLATTLAQALR